MPFQADSSEEKKEKKKSKKDKKDKKKRKKEADSDAESVDGASPKAKKAKTDMADSDAPAAEAALDDEADLSGETNGELKTRLDIRVTGEDAPQPVKDFSVFPAKVAALLIAQGFTTPTPIQMASWPVALAGRDVIAVAKTGSGKTIG
jgi:ATP-dependent helicase YprA (DUF1998 family)